VKRKKRSDAAEHRIPPGWGNRIPPMAMSVQMIAVLITLPVPYDEMRMKWDAVALDSGLMIEKNELITIIPCKT
jgi:hypothetical protein